MTFHITCFIAEKPQWTIELSSEEYDALFAFGADGVRAVRERQGSLRVHEGNGHA